MHKTIPYNLGEWGSPNSTTQVKNPSCRIGSGCIPGQFLWASFQDLYLPNCWHTQNVPFLDCPATQQWPGSATLGVKSMGLTHPHTQHADYLGDLLPTQRATRLSRGQV